MIPIKRVFISGVLAAALLAGLPIAASADATPKDCGSIENPYKGRPRFEGAMLTLIKATRVACPKARSVVRRIHRGVVDLPLRIRRRPFTWRGWAVTMNPLIPGTTDDYKAVKGSRRIVWRFAVPN